MMQSYQREWPGSEFPRMVGIGRTIHYGSPHQKRSMMIS